MMHDVDDATLMQALRDADPRRGSTHDDRARHRLEQSWREAMTAPAGRSARRRTIGAPGRTLHPIAVAIVAVVVLAGGVLVSNIATRRGAVQPDAGGVEGSYRAVQQQGDFTADTFLVAGGQALIRPASGLNMPAYTDYTEDGWRGVFGEVTSMRVDPQVRFDGDQMYLRIAANEEPFRWYRYDGSGTQWPPGLAETPQPVFEEGTRGFERVDDEDAHANGLTRYTADVDTADLDFLGWFGPTNDTVGSPVATVDIWVDGDGRVRRLEERTRTDPDYPTITRFDRFDAVDPIDAPYPEGVDAPVAENIAGMMLYAWGDPAFADELRERVTAELEGDADIAEFEIFERSAAERNDGPDLEDELFAVGLRFADDITADLDTQRRKLNQFGSFTAGDVPANAQEALRRGGVAANPRGYAAIYAPGLVSWMTLDG
jgi:hypothetical protein